MELIKLLPVHQYSVDIFIFSGPSGILGSDGMQNTYYTAQTGAGAWGCYYLTH